MASVTKDIELFLRRHLGTSKGVVGCELRHAAPGNSRGGRHVDSFPVPEGFDVEGLAVYIDDIVSRAQADANGLGGLQRYTLSVHVEGDKVIASLPFRIRSEDEDYDGDGEEAPTLKGLTSQLMRHNEANARTLAHSVGTITTVLGRRLADQDKLIERLISQRQTDLEVIEAALTRKHEREIEVLTVASQEQRKDKITEEMVNKVSVLLPVVINRLVGKKVLAADEPFAAQVRAFAESLKPEQFEKLMGSLDLEQQVAIVSLLKEVQDSDKKAGKQLSDGKSNGKAS